jgi:hypothetical protein
MTFADWMRVVSIASSALTLVAVAASALVTVRSMRRQRRIEARLALLDAQWARIEAMQHEHQRQKFNRASTQPGAKRRKQGGWR